MSRRLSRATLQKRHGTPGQFSTAVWKAYDSGVITHREALRGIAAYLSLWKGAQ